MKVYTEVNYIWKDNKLVQTDSKSFDYEGEIESCHWYHRHSTSVSIPTVADVTNAYKGSDIDKGLTSGQKAGGAALEKIKKDNPNPNLNLQTPDKLYNKGRQALHDAATNLKKIWDRNRPSYGGNDEEYTMNPTAAPSALLDEGPGSRATGSGTASNASGKSGKNKRVIREKNMPSLINQSVQKKLA